MEVALRRAAVVVGEEMRKTIVTCDICGSEHVDESYKIELSFYCRIQFNGFTVPDEKYSDLCFSCFDRLRKVIEQEMEKIRK